MSDAPGNARNGGLPPTAGNRPAQAGARWRRWGWLPAVLCCVAATAVVLAGPARAAAGTWGSWTAAGSSGGFTGTETLAGSGFPGGAFTSDATRLTTPTGASAFLNATTPPGTEFGSSQGHPYLNIGTASGDTLSTTTLTFDSPAPASGWAFVLGDVDADQVQIQATGPSGAAVPVSGLGFQGAFNYCNGTPLPSTCGGAPGTDEPTWLPAAGTLRGQRADTLGAAGWFEPNAAITSLTFRFATLTPGTPIFQLWLVSLQQPAPPASPTPSPTPTLTSATGPGRPPSPPAPSRPPSPSRSSAPSRPLVPVTG